mgnify:CR=1 FL=1
MKTLYNPTPRHIDGIIVDGYEFSIQDEQAKEVNDKVAKSLLDQFPFLEIIARNDERVEMKTKNIVLTAEKEKTLSSPMAMTEEADRFICSVCPILKEFDSKKGLNMHLMRVHKA